MKVSIIIATHARPESLARLLQSLAPQIVERRHEIIVAENGTPSQSRVDSPLPFVHLYQERPGKCAIQNRAMARATGELIVFLDDDLAVSSRYLAEVENFFDSHPQYAAMKGRIAAAENTRGESRRARAISRPAARGAWRQSDRSARGDGGEHGVSCGGAPASGPI